jgi:uncharacterized membrane protein
MIGPLEFIVIGSKGHTFMQEVLPELDDIQENDLIRVVDLAFVRKDSSGTVSVLEVHELNEEELALFGSVRENLSGVFTHEDIVSLTDAVPPDTSAVIVLLEHVWLVRLSESLNRANAVLLAGGMVPPAAMEKLEAELQALQGQSAENSEQ